MNQRNQPDIATIWHLLEEGQSPLGVPIQNAIWGHASGAGSDGPHGAKDPAPELMLQTVVTVGARTTEGQIIEAVTLPWFEIVAALSRDPSLINHPDWRKWEEIIAGAYRADGWDVILTPHSGDKGRDLIATRHDFGSIRILEQVKAYAPGQLVTLDQVSSMVGVLDMDRGASKGIVTTTSDFAPRVYDDERIKQMMPGRLDLRPRDKLLEWLGTVAKKHERA